MSIPNYIKFLKSCYQSDNRQLSLSSIYHDKVENRYFFSGKEELLNEHLPYVGIENKYAEEVNKNLSLFAREKQLFHFSFFLLVRSQGFQKRVQNLCVPLFLHPAEIFEKDGQHFVQIDFARRIINYNVLASLRDDQTLSTSDLVEQLHKELPPGIVDFQRVGNIVRVLKKHISSIDTESMLLYPDLTSEQAIKTKLKAYKANQSPTILPGSALGVVKKSTNTRGIVNGLTALSGASSYPAAFRKLFLDDDTSIASKEKIGMVPSILSKAQEQILESVAENHQTLIIGPPGTGKSYTIASLAVEQMSKGNTVLIAARTDQALDVIADKIENQLGLTNLVVKASQKDSVKRLSHRIAVLLSGIKGDLWKMAHRRSDLLRSIEKTKSKIASLEKAFKQQVEDEIDWGGHFVDYKKDPGFFKSLKKHYINFRNSRREPHWVIANELFELFETQQREIKEYISLTLELQVDRILKEHRKDLTNFQSAIKARTGLKAEALFEQVNFKAVLSILPIWLVNMSDIHDVFPLNAELFDVAIVDEATQCDIASALPMLYRGKKHVIAGDPQQLRHISFLSRSRQAQLAKSFEISALDTAKMDFRENSLLDFFNKGIADQAQVAFLDEHFRSRPRIIHFSNQQFYEGALKVMTQRPGIEHLPNALEIIDAKGKRLKSGYNKREAEEVITGIEGLINAQADFKADMITSIGVISPFRDQVDYIARQIESTFSLTDIRRHNIMIGTAFAFQGEERDIVFLSFAVDGQTHSSAFVHLNKPDVFNVAITRAKFKQVLIKSIDNKELDSNSLFRKYLDLAGNADAFYRESHQYAQPDSKDDFLKEVIEEIEEAGIEHWVSYHIGGLEVDVMMHHKNAAFALDLIGYPGEYQDAFSIDRYKMLQRVGIDVFPLPYTLWVNSRTKCMESIKDLIKY
ncbi:MAG: AAA domain-containing protein [Bacteroidota bacterium]